MQPSCSAFLANSTRRRPARPRRVGIRNLDSTIRAKGLITPRLSKGRAGPNERRFPASGHCAFVFQLFPVAARRALAPEEYGT